MEDKTKIGKSKVQGKGLLANMDLRGGRNIGVSHEDNWPNKAIGENYNHSDTPNARNVDIGNKKYVVPIGDIKNGEEITVDYKTMPEMEQPGNFIFDKNGQWNHPGKKTAVPTPTGKITTKGVEQTLHGVDNLGNEQIMYPNNEYQFPGNLVYETPMLNGGDIPESSLILGMQYGGATRSDSIAVMNNAKKIESYYSGYTEKYNNEIRDNWTDQLEGDRLYVKRIIDSGSDFETDTGGRQISLDEYRKDIDENKFNQRESMSGVLDMQAPMTLFDKRIKPQRMSTIANEGGASNPGISGDYVGLYKYDPLAVTPWDMLNDSQRKERVEKYGVSGTPMDTNAKPSKPKGTTDPNLSVDVRMRKMNMDSSYANRKRIAAEAGIENYKGSAEQNIALNEYVVGNYNDQGSKNEPVAVEPAPIETVQPVVEEEVIEEVKAPVDANDIPVSLDMKKPETGTVKPPQSKKTWKQIPSTGTWYQEETPVSPGELESKKIGFSF